ncbi:MAG: HPr-rel-A system PqqD family peptide chaperone [Methylococcaceae bacterium]|nr:HPr-rel-A system PqqD family peptide chaperone [Methylococcaceae bacterium]
MIDRVWRMIPGFSIETARWNDQLVLFNQLSGDTHLLNRPVDWVLDQLTAKPRSLNEFIHRAMEADIVGDDPARRQLLTNLLESLEKIDLLESEPPW